MSKSEGNADSTNISNKQQQSMDELTTEAWELTLRSVDSSFTVSQISVATTNSRESSSNHSDKSMDCVVDANKAGLLGGHLNRTTSLSHSKHADGAASTGDQEMDVERPPQPAELSTGNAGNEGGWKEGNKEPKTYGIAVDEEHVNFVLMHDMLTGIRHSVSVCQAKPSRPLTDQDFHYARTYNFLQDSSDTTPSKYEFRFKDYSPWVFRSLREAFKIDAADYLVSLTGKYVLSELGSPGKSGSFFYFSQDFRYIIKTIRQSEHQFLRKILRKYYEHVRKNTNSLVVRFYGLHRVRISNISKIYFVVMGNVFPPHRDIHEQYDLKGSTLGRFVPMEEMAGKSLVTLKDLNWVHKKKKLKLGPEKATILMNQLAADCRFLAKLRIMDYSLLVGIHCLRRGNREGLRDRSMMIYEPSTDSAAHGLKTATFKPSAISAAAAGDSTGIPNERKLCIFYSDEGGYRSSDRSGQPGDEIYYLGIIDILTPYTVSKKIEHAFKALHHDRNAISAVNPPEYSRRFLKFMSENILQDTQADYATKDLPAIPSFYSSREVDQDTVLIEDEEGSSTIPAKGKTRKMSCDQ